MKFCRYSFLAIALFLVSSCSTPPPEALHIPFFQSLDDFIKSEEHPASIPDLFFSFRRLSGTEDLVSSLYKGDRIIMTGQEISSLSNSIAFTEGKNTVRVARDTYLTCDRKRRLYFSFDGVKWFPMKNKQRKGIINIEYIYPLESEFSKAEGTFTIDFQWIAGKNETARQVRMKDKEYEEMQRGMIFYHTDSEAENLSLKDSFLKIPGGTEVTFYISFSGNLVKSSIEEGVHNMEILKDFHIYTTDDSDWKLGISLDGESWNFNPFDLQFELTEMFVCRGPDKLEYYRNMEINYGED